MEIKEINSIYWKEENGKETLIKDLKPNELQRCLTIVQNKQFKAYNTLEMHCKLEHAILKIAKAKKVELKDIDELEVKSDKITNKYPQVKHLVRRINNSIKLFLTKQDNGKEN